MQVGQKVRVCRDIGAKLGQMGTIQGYKMTDGSGVGVVVEFDDKTQTWFFEDEVEPVQ
jgi:hypothetical protein